MRGARKGFEHLAARKFAHRLCIRCDETYLVEFASLAEGVKMVAGATLRGSDAGSTADSVGIAAADIEAVAVTIAVERATV